MYESYQIIEPESLDDVYANYVSHELVVSILSWQKHELNSRLRAKNLSMEVNLVKIKYVDEYVAFAVFHGEDVEESMVEAEISALCEEITELPFSKFSEYLKEHKDIVESDIINTRVLWSGTKGQSSVS